MLQWSLINVKVTIFFFFKCLNSIILLTCTLANKYPSSGEISKKHGPVREDCIACDALLSIKLASQKKWARVWAQ